MSMSTTRSRRRIARMPRSRRWRICCRPRPARLMQAELEALGAALEHPQHPVMALVGGAKVSTKLDLLEIHHRARSTCWRSAGRWRTRFCSRKAGRSAARCASARWPTRARDILAGAEKRGCDDHPAGRRGDRREARSRASSTRTVGVDAVPPNAMILDIGPQTRRAHRGRARRSRKHAGVERPGRRLRDPALRPRHGGDRQEGRRADPGGQADERRRRRRHGRGARRRRGRATSSPMSRPPAAPFSNGSKARNCRASRRSLFRDFMQSVIS